MSEEGERRHCLRGGHHFSVRGGGAWQCPRGGGGRGSVRWRSSRILTFTAVHAGIEDVCRAGAACQGHDRGNMTGAAWQE